MTEIINLNQKRKANSRVEKAGQAAQNRVKFGRSKLQKDAEKRELVKSQKHLDAHQRESEGDKP